MECFVCVAYNRGKLIFVYKLVMSTEQRLCLLKPRFPYEVNEESRIFQL